MARPKKLDSKGVSERGGRFYWDVVRSLPSGQRWRKASDHASLEDAITARASALAEYERVKAGEQVVTANEYTVGEWCDHVLSAIMPTQASRRGKAYSPKTIQEYRIVVQLHIAPKIGTVALTKLTVDHVDALVAGIESEPLRLNVHKTLSTMMQLAEAKGKRPRLSNPCRGVRIGRTKVKRTDATTTITTKSVDPQDARRRIVTSTPVAAGMIVEKIRTLSFAEEAALLDHVRNHPHHASYETLILLGLRLGLRVSEALALDHSAIDFDAGTVTIDQQTTRVKGEGIQVGDVKSHAGNRTIPMPRSLADHLRRVTALSSSPHVVHNRKGERRDAARVANRLKELMEGCGLGDKVVGRRFLPRPTYHDLRKSFLSRLATGRVAEGVTVAPCPINTLILISGHESVEVLLHHYVSADDAMVRDAMSAMP